MVRRGLNARTFISFGKSITVTIYHIIREVYGASLT